MTSRKALALDGAEPSGGTPAALAAYHKADYEKWGKVITTAEYQEPTEQKHARSNAQPLSQPTAAIRRILPPA